MINPYKIKSKPNEISTIYNIYILLYDSNHVINLILLCLLRFFTGYYNSIVFRRYCILIIIFKFISTYNMALEYVKSSKVKDYLVCAEYKKPPCVGVQTRTYEVKLLS